MVVFYEKSDNCVYISNDNLSPMELEIIRPMMSMELCLWIEAHLLIELSEQSSPTIHKATNFGENIMPTDGSIPPNWSLRAHYAAVKCHKPQLAYNDRTLTIEGEALKYDANRVMRIIRENGGDKATHPDRWTEASEMVLKAKIPWRAIELLDLLDQAREKALYIHQTQEDISKSTNQTDQSDPTNLPTKPRTYQSSGARVAPPIGISNKVLSELYLPGQVTAEYLPPINPAATADIFVRQSTLPPRAKWDINVLARYSMVDIRSLHFAGRGRPKTTVMVSNLGIKFLEDLRNKGIINKRIRTDPPKNV